MLGVLQSLNKRIIRADENLEKLRGLTKIITHADLPLQREDGNIHRYKFKGEPKTTAIWYSAEAAVANLEMEESTTFPEHDHPTLEIHVILRGEIIFNMEGKAWHKVAGDIFYVEPNVPHGGTSLTDVSILCFTIPSDLSYPKTVED